MSCSKTLGDIEKNSLTGTSDQQSFGKQGIHTLPQY